jgi:hypothetical protein
MGGYSAIAPTVEYLFLFSGAAASQRYADLMTSGQFRTFLRGTIQYEDVFGATHKTMFCTYYFMNPKTGKTSFNACPTGNHMD